MISVRPSPRSQNAPRLQNAPAIRLLKYLRCCVLWCALWCGLWCGLVVAPVGHAELIGSPLDRSSEPVSIGTGLVLYAFFQDDVQGALAQALYVDARAALSDIGIGARALTTRDGKVPKTRWLARRAQLDDGERQVLLKATAALRLGLVASGREWLDALDPDELSPNARTRFDLARLRLALLDEDDALAATLLTRLPDTLRGEPDVRYAAAGVAMRAADFATATEELAALAPRGLARTSYGPRLARFGWFNLGVAARGQQDPTTADAAFGRLTALRTDDAEILGLRARARLASAYLLLETGAHDRAVAQLGMQQAHGPFGRQALSLRGELALAADDFATAAVVYGYLAALANSAQQQTAPSLTDRHTVAAVAAYPYSVERLRRAGQSTLDATTAQETLALYGTATGWLRERRDRLAADRSQLPAAVTALAELPAAWLPALNAAAAVAQEPPKQRRNLVTRLTGWLPFVRGLGRSEPPSQAAEAQMLSQLATSLPAVDWSSWLAGADVQNGLTRWHRLHRIHARVDALVGEAAALAEVSAEQGRRLRGSRQVLADSGLTDRLVAAQRATARQSPPSAAVSGATLSTYADPNEAGFLAELDSLRTRVAALAPSMTGDTRRAFDARIARLEGRLAYTIESDLPARQWAREKTRRQHAEAVAALATRAEALRRAAVDGRTDAGVVSTLARMQHTLTDVNGAMNARLTEQRQWLADSLAQHLDAEVAATNRALSFAQLAYARLSDELANAVAIAGQDASAQQVASGLDAGTTPVRDQLLGAPAVVLATPANGGGRGTER